MPSTYRVNQSFLEGLTVMQAELQLARIVMRDQNVLVLSCGCGHLQTEEDLPGLVGYPCDGCRQNVTILWPEGLNYPSSGTSE